MTKSKLFLMLVAVVFAAPSFAAKLRVACGKNAVEALEKDKPNVADVYLTFTLQGAKNPPTEVKVTAPEAGDLDKDNANVTFSIPEEGKYKFKVEKRKAVLFKVEGTASKCKDASESEATVEVYKNTGGFVGYAKIKTSEECVCLKD